MVGLPDGSERTLDQPPRPLAALGPAGHQVPEAGAEISATEERVEGRPDPEDSGADVGPGHAPASPLEAGGAYGVSTSGSAPPSRQRRDIERRTRIAIVPIAA